MEDDSVHHAPAGVPDSAKESSNSRRLTAALEFMRLARSEIQDRSRFTNQLLPAYLTSVAALLTWLSQRNLPLYLPLPLSSLLSVAGAYITFLFNGNEGMIGALAKYQIEQLSPVLDDVAPSVPLWECTFHARKHKTLWRERGMLLQTLIVIPVGWSPLLLNKLFASQQTPPAAPLVGLWTTVIVLADVWTIYLTIEMMKARSKIRPRKAPREQP